MAVELQQTCIVLATLKLIDRHNPNGAQHSSRLKFGVSGFHVRLSETLFWRELLVADNSVKPVVCDFDFELISLGSYGIRNFNTPRSRPDDTEVIAVQPYSGDATQLSKVEVNGLFGSRIRQVKVLSIRSDSTVVAYACFRPVTNCTSSSDSENTFTFAARRSEKTVTRITTSISPFRYGIPSERISIMDTVPSLTTRP
jgi:hypothetical protein|tara:strand:- start:1549 stop:2145 length:597 start_codon:yes stop_codon:yes gene_type:complete